MSNQLIRFGLTPREHRISALPSTVGSIVVLAITVFNGTVLWPQGPLETALLRGFGTLGIVYLVLLDLVVIPHPRYNASFGWLNATLTALGLAIISYSVSNSLNAYVGVLLVLAVMTSSIISDRGPSYILSFWPRSRRSYFTST
jgi:hypothetical protein